MAQSGIYEIVNFVNGKRYVGSAVDLEHRWREHRWGLNGHRHANRHLQASWDKHGEAAFVFQVVEICEVSQLIEREQVAIDRVKPEYNICPVAGSTLGRPHTDEAKAKIAAKKVGIKLPPRSEEYRRRVSERCKGQTLAPEHLKLFLDGRRSRGVSDEEREKHRANTQARWDSGEFSRDRSPEYRAKIAATLQLRAESPEVRERMRGQAADAWRERSPEERKLHMEMVRAARKPMSAEQRHTISERQRGRPMYPNAKSALLAANKGRKQSPEVVAARTERLREWWTPERKEQRAAAMRQHHAKRRAALE